MVINVRAQVENLQKNYMLYSVEKPVRIFFFVNEILKRCSNAQISLFSSLHAFVYKLKLLIKNSIKVKFILALMASPEKVLRFSG